MGVLSACLYQCVHWSGGFRGCQERKLKMEASFESVLSANKALESASQAGSEGLRRVMLKSFTLNL